jgi:hypothetical protein
MYQYPVLSHSFCILGGHVCFILDESAVGNSFVCHGNILFLFISPLEKVSASLSSSHDRGIFFSCLNFGLAGYGVK